MKWSHIEISNREEYRIVRDEMQRIKNCITTYLGYVLGGFGASLVSVFALKGAAFQGGGVVHDVSGELIDIQALVAAAMLLLAFTITLVLHILFYKFNSHNRYAGYCKLLNQEQLLLKNGKYQMVTAGAIDVMSWESCVDRLRDSDSEACPFTRTIDKMEARRVIVAGDRIVLASLLGKNKTADANEVSRGLWLLLLCLFGKEETKSWQFPVVVVRVFFAMCLVYGLLSIAVVWTDASRIISETIAGNLLFCLYWLLIAAVLTMWLSFARKLHRVLCGGATVEAYCWRFLPIRFAFISKQKQRKIEYRLITLRKIV